MSHTLGMRHVRSMLATIGSLVAVCDHRMIHKGTTSNDFVANLMLSQFSPAGSLMAPLRYVIED